MLIIKEPRVYEKLFVVNLVKAVLSTLHIWLKRSITVSIRQNEENNKKLNFNGLVYLKTSNHVFDCNACMLCVSICPVNCIEIVRTENKVGDSFPVEFDLEIGKCVFCGFCAEYCPEEAIEMTKYDLLFSFQNRKLDKEFLKIKREI